jgi:hypothetical protein
MEEASMSDAELLLHWLSHRARGTWQQFRNAVTGVGDSAGTDLVAGNIARSFSEMAHASFFVDGSRRWTVFAPCVAGLRSGSNAVLAGARSPALIDAVHSACETHGVENVLVELPNGLEQIRLISESEEQMRAVAGDCGISFCPDAAMQLFGDIRTVSEVLDKGIPTSRPVNWDIRSFDLSSMSWVAGHLNDTAYQFIPRSGMSRFAIARRGRSLVEIDKRNAVYAAAHLNGVPLLRYEVHEEKLSFPSDAPMPEEMSRVAAMCNGFPSESGDRRRFYANVQPQMASLLMATAGQAPLPPTYAEGPT